MKGHKTKTILERRREGFKKSEGTTLPGSRNRHKTYGGKSHHRTRSEVKAASQRATA